MQRQLIVASFCMGLLWPGALILAEVRTPQPTYSPEQLQQDFLFLQGAIAKTHPDPSSSTNAAQLKQAYEAIEARLKAPMTRNEAWRLLATLNPVFADAHLAVTQPDSGGQSAEDIKARGTLFPYEVHVDAVGDVYVRSELGGEVSPLMGARIDKINGVPARRVASELLARTHGDTAQFRANLLSRRWWFLYWKMYGAPIQYDLVIAKGDDTDRIKRSGSNEVPASERNALIFERQFRFELISNKVALLTLNTFAWPQDKKVQFYEFTESVFAKLRDAKIETLFIDIRENEGGDDDMWKHGILRYIADKPYRHGSSYRKRVIEGRVNASERLGDIIDGSIQTWEQPDLKNPLHFSGKIYVLVGRLTYSSSILFSNTMQDFGFGKLVGAGGYARVRSSGGIQTFVLPNTGLEITSPRFILDRPSGASSPDLVAPDIVLQDNPFDSRAMVNILANLVLQ